MMRSRTLIALVAGAVFGFSGAIAGDVKAERRPDVAVQAPAQLPWEQARLFAEVYERIKREYVDEVDDKVLMEKAIRGMVAALDPHSAFLDNDEFEEIRLSTMGSYPGVGIEVVAEDSAVKVLRPIEGSPADQAGMQSGDLIVKIDDKDVGADLAGAIAQMRGPAGSLVHLTVRRPTTGELLDFSLRRAKVDVHSVSGTTLEPGFGYVRITSFSETTADDVARTIATIKRDNPKGLHGLVLDLRNNPGGVLEAGVAVADAFLNDGVIVTADGRTPDARFRMEATPGDLIDGAELVVLVNGGSASAAEIVAGALKDHNRAELIGHKTYGKGSVQTVMPLSHGGAIKLTTSRYYTPSGVSIHGKGINPDIIAEGPELAPADIRVSTKPSVPLAARDREIQLALDTLKSHEQFPERVARTDPLAVHQ
ncbi:MAG TPA: S41 family peptidase [Steroidobacteraceae bacterium]|jgi:carboxyl-terminal processing protease|nr:S41 family peptidase [Steroidobacteraceae bacterium]